MARWMVVAVTAAVLALAGCEEEGSEEAGGGTPEGEATATAGPEGQAEIEGHRPHANLMERVHLADVKHGGLFIDFGTPARMKYTIGRWRTGWGSDGSSGDATYTYAGARGRVYFEVDEPGPLTVRMRLRPIGTSVVSPYLNGEEVELVRFQEGTGFRDYDLKIPGELVKKGENQLMLVFGGTEALGDEQVSVAMESIRIVSGSSIPGEEYASPSYGSLVGEVGLGEETRRAIAVRVPTTLSYYTQVPDDAKLVFGLGREGGGEAGGRVTVTPAGGSAKQVFDEAAGASWKNHVVDLGEHAGRVVRIDLEAHGKGGGRLAWAGPAVVVPQGDTEKAGDEARNVVVLLIDTLRASKLKPFNPNSRVKTPNLDKVAKEGSVFELAQSPENWTKPSVASILTSLHPASHGAKKDNSRLPANALMLSEHMKNNGFATGSFIANGYVSDKFGFDQGWDHYTNYIRESKSTEAENVFKEAGDWIEKHKGERFFAYIQTIDPHVPYDPPDEFLKMYDDREYDGQVKPRMTPVLLEKAKKSSPEVTFDGSDVKRLEALHDGEISYHDAEMGKFVERLKKLGLWENTLFVITSDHGEEFNEHGSWGHGHSTFQELLHVPLMFRMPGTVPEGQRVPQVVSTMDIAPTVLQLAGVDPMPDAEGESLVGYFRGAPPAGPAVAFSDFLDDRRVITSGRWKLVLKSNLNADFYDLEKDSGEQSPLPLDKHPVALRHARILIGQFLGATDRSRWLEGGQGEGTRLDSEDAQMDDTIRDQLRALGYAN